MRCRFFIRFATLLFGIGTVIGFAEQEQASRPRGVISGRVVDDDGRPVRGARVETLIEGFEQGLRRLVKRGNSSTTNDRGEFRLFWLEPGKYYVVIYPPQPLPGRVGYVPSDSETRFAMTYYPGTPDLDKA